MTFFVIFGFFWKNKKGWVCEESAIIIIVIIIIMSFL